MAMTATERTRLLRKFGDPDQTVFSNTELDDMWDEVSGASTSAERYDAALYLMFEALLNSSTKLHDYKAGSTEEDLKSVYAQLEKRAKRYEPAYDAAVSVVAEIARTALRTRPHQTRTFPNEGKPDDPYKRTYLLDD